MGLEERTVGGLHDFLMEVIFSRHARPGMRAVDLGAGSGALALRLRDLGLETLAVDAERVGFSAQLPFLCLDLNHADFAAQLGTDYDLVTSVEVIEHLESAVGFLRNVRHLLKPDGIAVITTPNVDNLPARVKFLLAGKLRMLDEHGDPTHISPIFWDLLTRKYLPLAGLELAEHYVYPPAGYKVTRRRYGWLFRSFALLLGGNTLLGDNHVAVLRRRREQT